MVFMTKIGMFLCLAGFMSKWRPGKLLGKWLTGTGWAETVYSAGVVTQGVAESLLNASHLSRTRRAH